MANYTLTVNTNLCDWIDSTAAYDSGDAIFINSGAVVTIDRTPASSLGHIYIEDGKLLVDGANATDPIHIWGKVNKSFIPGGSDGVFESTTGWYTHASTGDGTANQSISWAGYWSGAGEPGDFADILHGIWMEDTVEVEYTSESGTTPSIGQWVEKGGDPSVYGKVHAINTSTKKIQIENWGGQITTGTVLKVRTLVEQQGPQVILGWTATTTGGETLVTGVWTPMARLTKGNDVTPVATFTEQHGQGFLMDSFSDTMTFPYRRPRNGAHFRANMITVGTVEDEADFDSSTPLPWLNNNENVRYDFNAVNAGTAISRGICWGTGFGGCAVMGKLTYEYCAMTGAGGSQLGKQMEMYNCIMAPDPKNAILTGTKFGSVDTLSGYKIHDTLLICGDGESNTPFTFETSNNIDIQRCTFKASWSPGYNGRALKFISCRNITIHNNDLCSGVRLQTSSVVRMNTNRLSANPDGQRSYTTNTNAHIIEILFQCNDFIIRDFQVATGTAGRMIYILDSTNLKLRCIGSPDFFIPLNLNRNGNQVTTAGACENIDIARVYFDNTTSGNVNGDKMFLFSRTSYNITLQNIYGTYNGEWEPTGSNMIANSVTALSDGGINTGYGMEMDLLNNYGNMFFSTFSSATTGNLAFAFRDSDANSVSHFVATGDYYFDRRGRIGIYDSGTFEYTQQIFALGHTGFTGDVTVVTGTANSAQHGVNGLTSSITLEFQYDIGSGWNGTWLDADTASNLTGITITPTTGVKIKWKLSNNSGVLKEFGGILFETTTTAAHQLKTYTIDQMGVNFNNLVAGSQLVVYEAGTTNELYRNNSTGTTEFYNYSTGDTVDYTIIKTGQIPIRFTNVILTSDVVNNIAVYQIEDRAYTASSGLSFGSSCTINTTAKTFAITARTTVQNFYSFMVESFKNEATLKNVEFPLSTFGEASYSLNLDYEFPTSSYQYLHNDGFRYVTTAGAVKQIYCAILSQGITTGLTAKYLQVRGGSSPTSAINTGNVAQVIKIFGDASNGNIDYRNYLVFKVQVNGYRPAEGDVVSTYGTLGANLYVIGLKTVAIPSFTTGNPNLTNVTVTDNTSSPVSFNVGNGAKNYSYTITDGGATAGDDLQRYFNYHLSQSATFEGLPPSQYPELLFGSGASFESIRGIIRKSTGDATVGVRVMRGSVAHPDFTRFQSDDGTYGVVPVFANITISNIVSGSRLRIYNTTTSAEIYNSVVNATNYSSTYTNGTGITTNNVLNVRLTYQNGTSAKLGFEATVVATSSGFSVLGAQEDDTVYNSIGVDGSGVSEFSSDFVNNEIDVALTQNFSVQRLYARYVHFLSLEDGIRKFFGAIIAEDIANFKNDATVLDMYLNNNTSSNLRQTDNVRFYKSSGVYPARTTTTGGGGLDVVWRNTIFIAEVGTSGLTSAESTLLSKVNKLDNIEKNTGLIPAAL